MELVSQYEPPVDLRDMTPREVAEAFGRLHQSYYADNPDEPLSPLLLILKADDGMLLAFNPQMEGEGDQEEFAAIVRKLLENAGSEINRYIMFGEAFIAAVAGKAEDMDQTRRPRDYDNRVEGIITTVQDRDGAFCSIIMEIERDWTSGAFQGLKEFHVRDRTVDEPDLDGGVLHNMFAPAKTNVPGDAYVAKT